MGWRSREAVLGEHAADVISGGVFRGFALVDGRASGVWRFAGPTVALTPFGPLPDPVSAALEREGVAVAKFLGR
jgi:hypothetical protein